MSKLQRLINFRNSEIEHLNNLLKWRNETRYRDYIRCSISRLKRNKINIILNFM